LIRAWVESRLGGFWNRVNKTFDKSGLASEVRERWIEVLYIFAIVVMIAGTVDAVIEPVNFGYVIFPESGGQSATETVVDGFAVLLGAAGIYLSYLSGRQTTKSRMVNFYLIIGLLLIATSVYIGFYVLSAK
jgi:hypothetical protein